MDACERPRSARAGRVDNDSGADIWGWQVFANDDLNMLSRSFFVYTKAVGDDDDSRLFIRVHD